MLEKENLKYIENIISVNHNNVDLSIIDSILTNIRDEDYYTFFENILNAIGTEDKFKEILLNILHSIKDEDYQSLYSNIINIDGNINSLEKLNKIVPILHAIKDKDELNFYKSILPITNKDVDTTILNNVLKTVKHHKDIRKDVFDSFSNNQLEAKTSLLEAVKLLKILNKNSTVVIWGSWYGSILVPKLAPIVKEILCLDVDDKPIKIGKKKIFNFYNNVEYQKADIFEKYFELYKNTNLIINTSCEHMPPMKEWNWFQKGALSTDSLLKHKFSSPKLGNDCWFAFQSNNMYGIEGHINCVNSLDEFKSQLPERAEVRYADEIEDTRGTRYMLIGKLMPL